MRELRIMALTLLAAWLFSVFYHQNLAPKPVYGWVPVPQASFGLGDGYRMGASRYQCIANCANINPRDQPEIRPVGER